MSTTEEEWTAVFGQPVAYAEITVNRQLVAVVTSRAAERAALTLLVSWRDASYVSHFDRKGQWCGGYGWDAASVWELPFPEAPPGTVG